MTENRPNEEPKQPQSERTDESRPQAPNNGLRRVTGVIRVSSPEEQLAIREVFAQEFAGPNIPLKRPEPAKPIEELLVIPETVQVAVTRAAVPSEEVPTANTSEVDSWHDIAAENQPQMDVSSDIAVAKATKETDADSIAPEIRRNQDACEAAAETEALEETLEIDPNAIMAPRVTDYDSAEVVPPTYEEAESHFWVSAEGTEAEGLEAQTLCAVAPQVSEADLTKLETLAEELQTRVGTDAEAEAKSEALQAPIEAEQPEAQQVEIEETTAETQKAEPLRTDRPESSASCQNAQFAGTEVAVAVANMPTNEVATQTSEPLAEPETAAPSESESPAASTDIHGTDAQPAETSQATESTDAGETFETGEATETPQMLVEDGDAENEEETQKLSYAQRIGMKIEDWICAIGDFTIFACQVIWWLLRLPRRGTLIPCMYEIGIMSLPVIAMTGTFIGMVLAVQSYNQLKGFYLETRIGALINLSLVRELGPVLAATMLAGRIGSSMAAELGTMRVTEQIDALGSMGVNPIHYLVVPRFLSCVLLIPVLTIFADFMGIVGGAYFSVWIFHVDWHFYLTNSNKIVGSLDVFIGIFKSLFFGAAIGLIGCHRGFHSRAGAQGVGRAATEAFVFSFVTILLLDLALGILIESLIQFLPTMPRQL